MPENEVSFDEELLSAELSTMDEGETLEDEDVQDVNPVYATEEPIAAENAEGQKPVADAAKQAAKTEEPEKYVLPLLGQDMELEGDELIQLAEAGAHFMQHKEEVQQALAFVEEVRNDPALMQLIREYGAGNSTPQKQVQTSSQAPVLPENSPELQGFNHLIEMMLPRLMQAVEEKYNPDVTKTMQEVQQLRVAQEFGRYQTDPDYPDIVGVMQAMLVQDVRHGKMTMQQAAATEQKLRTDPKFFGQHFTAFKKFVAQAKKGGVLDTPAEKQAASPASPVRIVSRAPKLEAGKSAAPDVDGVSHVWARALSGDAEAISALYDMQ